jgi:hypothetical protein
MYLYLCLNFFIYFRDIAKNIFISSVYNHLVTLLIPNGLFVTDVELILTLRTVTVLFVERPLCKVNIVMACSCTIKGLSMNIYSILFAWPHILRSKLIDPLDGDVSTVESISL